MIALMRRALLLAVLGAAALFLLFGSLRFRHIRAEHASP